MHHCQAWLHYADAQEKFEQWAQHGMGEGDIKRWGLGFCDACPVFPQHASLTIPVFYHGQLFDIRHRLIDGDGPRYCSHMPGLTPSFFNLDSVAGDKTVYITEGEKKVISLARTGLRVVVGVPGQAFYKRLAQIFERILEPNQEVVFIPDPGTVEIVAEYAQKIKNKTYVVEGWLKPDDLLAEIGIPAFHRFLEMRRPL